MRKMMNKHGEIFNVKEWFMTVNHWEYYILDEETPPPLAFALVLGFEDEMGDISLDEIRPFIIAKTNDLSEVMPATGWKWIDQV